MQDNTDISQITNSIYISTLQTLQNNSVLRENGITHILLAVPIDDQQYTTTEEFQFMNVSLYDTESEDLLSQLPACMEFIENGVIQGKVAVCCVAGMSRSPGIVIAYLMKQLNLDLNAAFNMVSEKRPCIMPNRGFMLQLQWWDDMNFTIDSNHNQYKLFILKRAHKPMDFSRPNDLSDIVDGFKASLSGDTVLKCKACRKVILTHAELITHEPEDQAQSSFPYSKRDDNFTRPSNPCGSYFIVPPPWLTTEKLHGEVEGKIDCPTVTCKAKLGSFRWQGSQCSCGKWVTPAFMIAKRKVDEAIERQSLSSTQ